MSPTLLQEIEASQAITRRTITNKKSPSVIAYQEDLSRILTSLLHSSSKVMSKPTEYETEGSELSIPPLKIAVEGCVGSMRLCKSLTASYTNYCKGHGSLDIIYSSLEKACDSRGWTLAELDFLIICGDFQENISLQFLRYFVINKLLGCSECTRFELHVGAPAISTNG